MSNIITELEIKELHPSIEKIKFVIENPCRLSQHYYCKIWFTYRSPSDEISRRRTGKNEITKKTKAETLASILEYIKHLEKEVILLKT